VRRATGGERVCRAVGWHAAGGRKDERTGGIFRSVSNARELNRKESKFECNGLVSTVEDEC